jgi:plasmid stabilization system protein ParE
VKRYTVVFAPEAAEQLERLYAYVADAASPTVALNYTNAIVSYCDGLKISPHRGMQRNDIRPGLRVTNYKKRAVIAFTVESDLVSIIGIYYGGQDFEADLMD